MPRASDDALMVAVVEAVKQGRLWLTSGQASILREDIPAGILTSDARLQAPPLPIPTTDLSETNMPEVWTGNAATALAIAVALSQRAGTTLPWATIRDTIDGAIRARIIELTLDSAPWPCDFTSAQNVKLKIGAPSRKPEVQFTLRPDILVAEAELRPNEIQDLAEQLPEIRKIAGATNLKIHVRLELDGRGSSPGQDLVANLNSLLSKISKSFSLK